MNSDMSELEFAEAIGISPQALALFESNESLPSAETLAKIAESFAVDLTELLCGVPSPAIQTETESLRIVKHNFRMLQVNLRQKLKVLKNIDRGIAEAIKAINTTLKPYKAKASAEKKIAALKQGVKNEQGKEKINRP